MTITLPYSKVQVGTYLDGSPKWLDARTRQMLDVAEAKLGYPLTIIQGSYHPGVGQSAGTHDGGGAVDLMYDDVPGHPLKIPTLRDIGFAAWKRPTIPGVWSAHLHAVDLGNVRASAAAKAQWADYRNGLDGLADHAADSDPYRPDPIPVYQYLPHGLPIHHTFPAAAELRSRIFAARRAAVQLAAERPVWGAENGWLGPIVAGLRSEWAAADTFVNNTDQGA